MKRLIAILVLTISLAGCAGTSFDGTAIHASPNQAAAVEQEKAILNSTKRLFNVYHNVSVAGTGMCGERVRYMSGLTLGSRSVAGEWASAYTAITGISDDSLHVQDVTPGSGADKAGMKPGDKLLAVNGQSLVLADGISMDMQKYKLLNEQGQEAVFAILRDGKRMEVKVQQDKGCDFGLSPQPNTRPFSVIPEWYTTYQGRSENDRLIIFSTGMVEFCKTDDEIAVILGHEMTHLLKNHLKDIRGNLLKNAVWDSTLTVLTSGLYNGDARDSQVRKAEVEADYIGLYFTARAGYDISQAGPFWKRMEAVSPVGKDHPTGEQRDIAAKRTADEIKAKQAAGKPLEPGV